LLIRSSIDTEQLIIRDRRLLFSGLIVDDGPLQSRYGKWLSPNTLIGFDQAAC